MLLDKIIKKQPIVNIGIIGHVSNGKSSVTKCLTGIATQKHSDEKKRNITIKLGYANARIFKCPTCEEPSCFQSTGEDIDILKCKHCSGDMELVNHISICDVPGHNLFMTAMMNGTSVMDYTILIESVMNTEVPAPQTKEHLLCTNISGIPNIANCINKLDLVKKIDAQNFISKLKKELIGTQAENSPIIPVSASLDINIDVITQILSKIKPQNKCYEDKAIMYIVRSFNVNKCGAPINKLIGGIIGGTIIKGTLNLNDEIIIKPGYITKNDSGKTKFKYCPLKSKISTINSEKTKLDSAISGGLIGVGLDIDPGLTGNDGLVGSILLDSSYNELYKVYEELELEFEQLRKDCKKEISDSILINVNSCNCQAKVISHEKNIIKIELLNKPACLKINDYCTISNYQNDIITIMGRGKMLRGKESIIY
jgi:translation initiation factor 2 subunit 3